MANRTVRWADRVLDFDKKTYVMGILNCTPDSFYPASRRATTEDAVAAAQRMIRDGADILDVGGESSRPGSDPVPPEEEAGRVIPVIKAIRAKSDITLSIDTTKREVAERALEAGADIINDISGLAHEVSLADLAARTGAPLVLMHMRGTPKTMQKSPFYEDTIGEILKELSASVDLALSRGVARERIIVDPGIGFGKRVEDNLRIIRELASLKSLGFPILVGLSRKGFLGEILDRGVDRRLTGTIAAQTIAVINGADIIRAHDVAEAVEMAKVIDAVRRVTE